MHDLQIFDSSLAYARPRRLTILPTIVARLVVGSLPVRPTESSCDKATSGPLFIAKGHFGLAWEQRASGGPKRSIAAGIEQLADNAALELQATDGCQSGRDSGLRSASTPWEAPYRLTRIGWAECSSRCRARPSRRARPPITDQKALRRAPDRPSVIRQG